MGATINFTEPGTVSSGVCYETQIADGGWPSAIETALLSPLPWPNLERLRKELLANCSTSMNPHALVRTVVVLAAAGELKGLFQTLVPQITAEELAVKLCSRRRVVDVDAAIMPKVRGNVAAAMGELRAMGVTHAYVELLESTYIKDSFNSRVSALAGAVVIAAAVQVG